MKFVATSLEYIHKNPHLPDPETHDQEEKCESENPAE